MLPLLIALLVASNGTGKQLVRTQPGATVPMAKVKRTNYAPNPRDACAAGNVANTGWTLTAATCTSNTGADPEGGSAMDTVTSSANNGSLYATMTVPSSTGPFTSSAFVRSVSGSAIETVGGACGGGTATVLYCSRSDGGVCNTATTGINAYAYGTFDTTAVRMSVTWTCATAQTTVYGLYHDGRYVSTFGVGGMFWGLKVEVGPYPTQL